MSLPSYQLRQIMLEIFDLWDTSMFSSAVKKSPVHSNRFFDGTVVEMLFLKIHKHGIFQQSMTTRRSFTIPTCLWEPQDSRTDEGPF